MTGRFARMRSAGCDQDHGGLRLGGQGTGCTHSLKDEDRQDAGYVARTAARQ